jgi:hypothetical protein
MGHFYLNITLRGPARTHIIEELTLQGRVACLSPTTDRDTVIYDEAFDDQDEDAAHELTAHLTTAFNCLGLIALNHDDDIFCYWLYDSGTLLDSYNSTPSFFDPDARDTLPSGGDVNVLCQVFQSSTPGILTDILHQPTSSNNTYVLAVERHLAFVQAIGLPEYAVGIGYEDIVEDNIGEELNANLFTFI